MNRVLMAAGVAVVNGHADQGQSWKSGIKYFPNGVVRTLFASQKSPEFRRATAGCGASDESLRQVMYLNCWGQS